MEAPRLLKYLTESSFLSGEAVANRLNISRAAVWKEIEALRRLGYEVEAVPNKGYRLAGRPDRLYPWEIQSGLDAEFMGREIHYFASIDSTNNAAKAMLGNGPPEGTLVLAEEQTTGRGRMGRFWSSAPDKGIWMSLILRPRIPVADLPKMTILTGVAVRRAIVEATGMEPLIKWPNDILLDGRKICGILAELSGEIDRVAFLVMGMGINVNHEKHDFPEELREKAGSLAMTEGKPFSRVELVRLALKHFEDTYQQACQNGFSDVLSECRRYSATLGRTVTIREGSREITGLAEALGDDGGLILRLSSGESIPVYAGEMI